MKVLKKGSGLIFILLVLLSGNQLLAQRVRTAYTEFAGGVGTLNHAGDIATTNSTEAIFKEVRPQIKIMAKRHFNDWFGMGVETGYGWLSASDANHSNFDRGFSTEVGILQINVFSEVHLIRFGKYHLDDKFSIYLKFGGGLLAYDPEIVAAETYGATYEPALNAYTSFNTFFGGGVKFRTDYRGVLGVELVLHNAGTDQLEGLNITTVSSQNDVYGGIFIYYSYLIF